MKNTTANTTKTTANTTANTTKKEEKTMKNTTANTTKKEETRPVITAATDTHLQPNSLDIEAEVFDTFSELLSDDLKIRRWACNKNLYTFYLGKGQVAEITFRRKDFRVACRPAYASEDYKARKSGYGLDAYTDAETLGIAVSEVAGLLTRYKEVTAAKKAEKEKAAAEKKAKAEAKKAEKEKKAAEKKAAEKEKKTTAKKATKKTTKKAAASKVTK